MFSESSIDYFLNVISIRYLRSQISGGFIRCIYHHNAPIPLLLLHSLSWRYLSSSDGITCVQTNITCIGLHGMRYIYVQLTYISVRQCLLNAVISYKSDPFLPWDMDVMLVSQKWFRVRIL